MLRLAFTCGTKQALFIACMQLKWGWWGPQLSTLLLYRPAQLIEAAGTASMMGPECEALRPAGLSSNYSAHTVPITPETFLSLESLSLTCRTRRLCALSLTGGCCSRRKGLLPALHSLSEALSVSWQASTMPRIIHTLCKTPCSQPGPPVLRSLTRAGQGLLPRQQSALHTGQGRVRLLQEVLPGRAGCAAGVGP